MQKLSSPTKFRDLKSKLSSRYHAEQLNSLLARYPLKRRIPAAWHMTEGALSLHAENNVEWLLALLQACDLLLEKLDSKPQGCVAAYRVVYSTSINEAMLTKIEARLRQNQEDHKQQKNNVGSRAIFLKRLTSKPKVKVPLMRHNLNSQTQKKDLHLIQGFRQVR